MSIVIEYKYEVNVITTVGKKKKKKNWEERFVYLNMYRRNFQSSINNARTTPKSVMYFAIISRTCGVRMDRIEKILIRMISHRHVLLSGRITRGVPIMLLTYRERMKDGVYVAHESSRERTAGNKRERGKIRERNKFPFRQATRSPAYQKGSDKFPLERHLRSGETPRFSSIFRVKYVSTFRAHREENEREQNERDLSRCLKPRRRTKRH